MIFIIIDSALIHACSFVGHVRIARQVLCCLDSQITRCWDVEYLIFVMNEMFLHWCGQTKCLTILMLAPV